MRRKIISILCLTLQLIGISGTAFSQLFGEAPDLLAANRKPDLSCILFGDTACQITCHVLCDLYGCHSRARCIDDVSCDCGEIYTVRSENLTVDEYRKQNLTELWYYNFAKSFAARRVFSRINQNPSFNENVTALLRHPHVTGALLQSELLEIRPKWSLLYYMKPTRRGHINEIFHPQKGFNKEEFKAYFDRTIDAIINRTYSQITAMTNVYALPSLFRYLLNENNVRSIIGQILWFPNNTLLNLISDYSRRAKYYDFFRGDNSNASVDQRENEAFAKFKNYLWQAVDNLADQVFGKIQEMKLTQELPRLTAYISTKNDAKNLMSLLLMFPNESLFDLMRNLMMQQRNDTYMISKRSPPQLYVLPSDIDELIAASTLEKLLKVKIHYIEQSQITTTPPPPTTTKALQSGGTFQRYIKRLLSLTFGLSKTEPPNVPASLNPKNYPDLRVLLTQLMEYLVNATNTAK